MDSRQKATVDMIQKSVVEVLQTTFKETPEIVSTEGASDTSTQVIASMGLSGSLDASIAVGMSQETACLLVSKMLGSPASAYSQEVVDGVGELVNILAGVIKTRFAESGCIFILSLPVVITASVSVSMRRLMKSEGVALTVRIFGQTLDVYFFYSRPSMGLVTLSGIISKALSSQDATDELVKLMAQKPKI